MKLSRLKKKKQKTKHLQHACVVVVVAEDVLLTKTTGRISLYFFTHPFSQKYIKKKSGGLNGIPLVQLTGCEVQGNSRRLLRVSLAGRFEVFHSFTLSSLFGVSVEHVALAFVTHKAFPSVSPKPLVAFQARV